MSFKVYILVTRLIYGIYSHDCPHLVLLFDFVSIDNCVFKSEDPQLVNKISAALQLGFMVILFLVHLCI